MAKTVKIKIEDYRKSLRNHWRLEAELAQALRQNVAYYTFCAQAALDESAAELAALRALLTDAQQQASLLYVLGRSA